jgi:predicted  nucleic acid-binding Zn-ribbon protein
MGWYKNLVQNLKADHSNCVKKSKYENLLKMSEGLRMTIDHLKANEKSMRNHIEVADQLIDDLKQDKAVLYERTTALETRVVGLLEEINDMDRKRRISRSER